MQKGGGAGSSGIRLNYDRDLPLSSSPGENIFVMFSTTALDNLVQHRAVEADF